MSLLASCSHLWSPGGLTQCKVFISPPPPSSRAFLVSVQAYLVLSPPQNKPGVGSLLTMSSEGAKSEYTRDFGHTRCTNSCQKRQKHRSAPSPQVSSPPHPAQPSLQMPRPSAKKQALKLLQDALNEITEAQALEILNMFFPHLNINSDPDSESNSSYLSSMPSTPSTAPSYDTSGSDQSHILYFSSEAVLRFQNQIQATIDEVNRACTLQTCIRTIHAPQIHLLKEWRLNRPAFFRRKLRVSPDVFSQLVERIRHHPIFLTSRHSDSGSDGMPLPNPNPIQPAIACLVSTCHFFKWCRSLWKCCNNTRYSRMGRCCCWYSL